MAFGESKEKVLEQYGSYVRVLALQVRKQFRSQLETDELVAWGNIGLLEAAQRFDPKVGVNFITFAHYRIKGAIYDGLRKMGVLRGAAAAAERADAYLTNVASTAASAGSPGRLEDDVEQISSAVAGLAMVFASSMGDAEIDTSLPADERLELEELRKRVRAAMAKLPEKERLLLEAYYFQNKTLEEAGATIGQSKSWSSRLHARAVDTLKQLLEADDENPLKTSPRSNDHGRTPGRHIGAADRPAEAPRAGPAAGQQGGRKQV